jgi:hypothetical protein
MKKIVLLAAMSCITLASYAQKPQVQLTTQPSNAVINTVSAATTKASSLTPENMYFKFSTHDFGTIQEGPSAEHEFEFVNTGKEPIIISNVSASCGCTTPSYSKDPVLPGKKGTIKAIYNTQGRVSPFTKTISITSNAGLKVLTIKGEVEKAPSGSVPENNSMIKTN